tara:strand:+ start:417 stop:821 length:405 start_codon:yes stop_codon:yes gene_type:complete
MYDFQSIIDCVTTAKPDVLAIYQFGSAGTQYERPDSDIDVAILPTQTLSSEERLMLINKLMDATGRDFVDLVDLSDAPTVTIFEIITQGKRIYCKNEEQAEAFESLEFSKYVRLNEERAAIIHDVKARGSIYGQ